MKPCLVHFKGTEADTAVTSIQVKTCSPAAGEKRPWNMFFIKLARPVALLAFSFSGLLMLSIKIGYHLIANRTFGAKLSCGFVFFFFFCRSRCCFSFRIIWLSAVCVLCFFSWNRGLMHCVQDTSAEGFWDVYCILNATTTRGQIIRQNFPVSSMPEISQSNVICIMIRKYNKLEAVLLVFTNQSFGVFFFFFPPKCV